MGARINAACETGDNYHILRTELRGNTLGKGKPCGRSIARADNGNSWPRKESNIAQHAENGWRRINRAQAFGIIIFTKT